MNEQTASGSSSVDYLALATQRASEITSLRRELHGTPEVGLHLPRTRELVLAGLAGLPLEITTSVEDSSIVAVLRGGAGTGEPAPSVLLRADMDALPVHEGTDLPFAYPGDRMHACGHDLHTAMLVGAATVLSEQRATLAGDVVMLFQPGEEGYDGAQRMIDAGALDASGTRPSAAYALHVTSARFDSGVIATRPGPLMAAADVLRVVVRGAGGHASAPHEALDPIPVAAEMITSLQTLVTRRFNAFDPVVLTVGYFQAGTLNNIIPASAEFHAAVRTFSPESQKAIAEHAVRLCRGIAEAHGLTADVEWETLYPVTVNDGAETAFMQETAGTLFGADSVVEMGTAMAGAEDFSRILQEIPGAMGFLGATAPGVDATSAPFNHSPMAVFDEPVLPRGSALLARLAADRLALGSRS